MSFQSPKAECAFRNWAVAIVRYVYLIKTYNSNDLTWLLSKVLLWSIIEINTGLICACVPTLKPFFREVVAKNLVAKSWPSKWKFEDALGFVRKQDGVKIQDHTKWKATTHGTSDISLGSV